MLLKFKEAKYLKETDLWHLLKISSADENTEIIIYLNPLHFVNHSPKYSVTLLQKSHLAWWFYLTLFLPKANLYHIYLPLHHLSAKSYCLKIEPLLVIFLLQFISRWLSFLLQSRYHDFICLSLSTFIP